MIIKPQPRELSVEIFPGEVGEDGKIGKIACLQDCGHCAFSISNRDPNGKLAFSNESLAALARINDHLASVGRRIDTLLINGGLGLDQTRLQPFDLDPLPKDIIVGVQAFHLKESESEVTIERIVAIAKACADFVRKVLALDKIKERPGLTVGFTGSKFDLKSETRIRNLSILVHILRNLVDLLLNDGWTDLNFNISENAFPFEQLEQIQQNNIHKLQLLAELAAIIDRVTPDKMPGIRQEQWTFDTEELESLQVNVRRMFSQGFSLGVYSRIIAGKSSMAEAFKARSWTLPGKMKIRKNPRPSILLAPRGVMVDHHTWDIDWPERWMNYDRFFEILDNAERSKGLYPRDLWNLLCNEVDRKTEQLGSHGGIVQIQG